MNFAHPDNILYLCTTTEKFLYDFAHPGQGFVWLVQLPQKEGSANCSVQDELDLK
jgi:hypothetical protein